MTDKYEQAARDGQVGASISLEQGQFVRPSYLHFLRLRDSGQIPKGVTHNRWEEENQELVRKLDASQ